MKKYILILAPILMLLLSGCGDELKSGTVVSKHYEPASTSTYWMPQYTTVCTPGYNGVQNCTQQFSYYIPIESYDDPDWVLHLKQCNNTGGEKNVKKETPMFQKLYIIT